LAEQFAIRRMIFANGSTPSVCPRNKSIRALAYAVHVYTLYTMQWTPKELKLLGTAPDHEIAARLGLSRLAVLKARLRNGVAPFIARSRKWSAAEKRLLGTMPDGHLAKRLNCSRLHVYQTRMRLKIKAFGQERPKGD
jgi:hypothetical protein